jgi:hypothetical protein
VTQVKVPFAAVHTKQTVPICDLQPPVACTRKIVAETRGSMARKSIPQPLTLANSLTLDDEHNSIDHPRSPFSPTSPKSPRSPFNFKNSKKTPIDQSLMQPVDLQQPQATLSPAQQSLSLPTLQQSPITQEKQEKDRSSRSGFFANYKASKSSSRLQNSETAKQSLEDMSRDTDRGTMPGKVSSRENSRTGTTHSVSSSLTLSDVRN